MNIAHLVIRAPQAFWTALNRPKWMLVGAVGGYVAMEILAPALSLIGRIHSPVADAIGYVLGVAFAAITLITFYCLIVGTWRLHRFIANAPNRQRT